MNEKHAAILKKYLKLKSFGYWNLIANTSSIPFYKHPFTLREGVFLNEPREYLTNRKTILELLCIKQMGGDEKNNKAYGLSGFRGDEKVNAWFR